MTSASVCATISAQASAYPAGLNAMLAGVTVAWLEEVAGREGWEHCLPRGLSVTDGQPLEGLYSGSAKPHASWLEAASHIGTPSAKIGSASLRRLEPELESVLRLEGLPAVNVMAATDPLLIIVKGIPPRRFRGAVIMAADRAEYSEPKLRVWRPVAAAAQH